MHRIRRVDSPGRRSGKSLTGVVVFLLIAGGAAAVAIPDVRTQLTTAFSRGPVDVGSRYILRTAELGPFRIVITENGTVDSLRNATLVSRIEGSTTIISLAPEGSRVSEPAVAEFDGVAELADLVSQSHRTVRLVGDGGQVKTYEVSIGPFTEILVQNGDHVRKGEFLAGDVVCELDASVLVDKEREQQIKLTTAQANLEKAQKNIQIQETTNESNVAKAKLAEELAQLDKEKYTAEGGEFQQALQTLKGDIKKYEEELAMNKEAYERVREEARRGYSNLNVLEAARIKVNQSQILLNVKMGEVGVLEKFTFRRTESELKQLAEDTIRETRRAILEGEAAMALQKADYDAARLTEAVEREKLALLRRQIRESRLVAPQAGEVVYASQKSSRSEPVIIEEGASVRERQAIIKLPDVEMMKIDARIHESKISRVAVGQRAEIEIDALPGDPYTGVLQSVSSVPMPGSWPNTDLKEYQAAVEIRDSPERVRKLKPGMTAQVRIIVGDRKEDVLQIPVQSVVSFSSRYFTYVADIKSVERREIKVGDANDEYLEILDGVAAGDRVVMGPRSYFSKEISELETRLSAEAEATRTQAETSDAAPDSGPPNRPRGAASAESASAASPSEPGSERRRGPGRGDAAGPEEPRGDSERPGRRQRGGDAATAAGSGRGAPSTGGGPPGGGPSGGGPSGGGGFDPKAIFDRQDTNGDGVITKDESARPESFDRIDLDGDGKVTLEEMQAAFKKMQQAQQ